MKPAVQSLGLAYQQAALKSEQYRSLGILLVIALFIVVNGIRLALAPFHRAEIERYCEFISFWIVCGAYEGTLLYLTNRARRLGRPTRTWVLVMNTTLECLLPTVSILGLTMDKGYLGPWLALSTSSLILYCFFIILATLRLSAALCIYAGAVSALGYVLAYLFTLRFAPNNPNRQVFPPAVFMMTPLMIFVAGLIAAAVAHEIRRHLMAALAEAQTRAKLDRVEHDLQIARQIQMGLLPKKPPTIAGYDIAGWSQPADQTGGDYYDWMELPGGRVLFTVADASGHGIGPALLVTACRAYFRAIAVHGDPLEQITQQVDHLIAADVPAGRFITAVVALLEPAQHRLSLYSAGHAPLYWYTAGDDRVEEFDSDQPPLGLCYRDGDTRARVLEFMPGDTLVLVTDGLFEFANAAGELVGTERVGAAIRRHRVEASEMMIRKIYAEVAEFGVGVTQGDDMTAVVIKRQDAGSGSALNGAGITAPGPMT
jgi:serine phosphatase RsbU (regulator of sigma subunit)